jgi:hypothetical protein
MAGTQRAPRSDATRASENAGSVYSRGPRGTRGVSVGRTSGTGQTQRDLVNGTLVSLTTNSPHISAPRRRFAAFSSSPLALLAASSSALRCIHPATNLIRTLTARW